MRPICVTVVNLIQGKPSNTSLMKCVTKMQSRTVAQKAKKTFKIISNAPNLLNREFIYK